MLIKFLFCFLLLFTFLLFLTLVFILFPAFVSHCVHPFLQYDTSYRLFSTPRTKNLTLELSGRGVRRLRRRGEDIAGGSEPTRYVLAASPGPLQRFVRHQVACFVMVAMGVGHRMSVSHIKSEPKLSVLRSINLPYDAKPPWATPTPSAARGSLTRPFRPRP